MAAEWTSADLARIDAAIASGVRSVRFQDRTVEYASMQDLRDARTDILVYLASQSAPLPTRQLRTFTDKGFGN